MLRSKLYYFAFATLVGVLLMLLTLYPTPAFADQLFSTNVIVRNGGFCLGQGTQCASPGEDFSQADFKFKADDAPTLRFEQTTGGGFPAQIWDTGGDEIAFFIADFSATPAPTFPFQISTRAPSNSLRIGTNGTVGFGTATPIGNGQGIHIFGAATTDVFSGVGVDPNVGPSFNFGYSGFSFGRGSGFFNARPDASSVAPNPSVRFMTLNLQRMIIANNGNVGIGQFGAVVGSSPGTSPLAKLHVQGNVFAEGSITSAVGFFAQATPHVPDYVFESTYNLLPLKQLAAYVEKEKHLPDVPSAQDIKVQGGINLGDMQMTLLKKVEELTLYTLQQERQLTSLQQQNRRLKTQNMQLSQRLSAIEAVVQKITGR